MYNTYIALCIMNIEHNEATRTTNIIFLKYLYCTTFFLLKNGYSNPRIIFFIRNGDLLTGRRFNVYHFDY